MLYLLFMCAFLTWPLWGLKVTVKDLAAIRAEKLRRQPLHFLDPTG